MNRNQIFAVVVCFLLLASVNVVSAQSKDRANPTPLGSGEISGIVDSESRGNYYYYSFIADPGEVTITLTVDPGKGNDFLTVVGFSLYDRNGEEIAGKSITTGNMLGSKQAVARIEVTRQQTFVLAVSIPEGSALRSVGGRYRIRIDGSLDPVATSQLKFKSENKTDKLECLPKQGTLIVKMKDGSKKIIDLSEAETITVVP